LSLQFRRDPVSRREAATEAWVPDARRAIGSALNGTAEMAKLLLQTPWITALR